MGRNLYVSNLSYDTSDAMLKQLFAARRSAAGP
jgi:hypothetical protein